MNNSSNNKSQIKKIMNNNKTNINHFNNYKCHYKIIFFNKIHRTIKKITRHSNFFNKTIINSIKITLHNRFYYHPHSHNNNNKIILKKINKANNNKINKYNKNKYLT